MHAERATHDLEPVLLLILFFAEWERVEREKGRENRRGGTVSLPRPRNECRERPKYSLLSPLALSQIFVCETEIPSNRQESDTRVDPSLSVTNNFDWDQKPTSPWSISSVFLHIDTTASLFSQHRISLNVLGTCSKTLSCLPINLCSPASLLLHSALHKSERYQSPTSISTMQHRRNSTNVGVAATIQLMDVPTRRQLREAGERHTRPNKCMSKRSNTHHSTSTQMIVNASPLLRVLILHD